MSLTTLHAIRVPPPPTPRNARLWRVGPRAGSIVGPVGRVEGPQGEKYRARLLRAGMPAGAEIGEFWSVEDAVEVFRVA